MERQAPSATLSFPVIAGTIRTIDFLLLSFGGFAATETATHLHGNGHTGPQMLLASLVGSFATVMFLAREGFYQQDLLVSLGRQVRRLVKPLLLGMLCLIAYLFVLHRGELSLRSWPFTWAIANFVLLSLVRLPQIRLLRHWASQGRLARKVAMVGVSEFSREFIERLLDEPQAFQLVGLYDDRGSRVASNQIGVPLLGTVQDLLERSQREQIDVIVVALPLSAVDRIAQILEKLGPAVADVCLTTDMAGLRFSAGQFRNLGRNAIVTINEAPFKDWRVLQKAVLDYGLGTLALILFSPVLLLTAALIRWDSPGPVLFRQPRVGFNNRMFLCYKFRSMHHGMTDLLADRQTTRADPRITRVGRVIRKLSIDELPQLLNVLNGTMSLVGPRPHAPNTKAADQLFADVVRQYAHRHRVKPGITGWAQANGWRGETTTVEQIEQRVAYDLFYIENWSIGFDLRIMAMTVLREVRSRHAF